MNIERAIRRECLKLIRRHQLNVAKKREMAEFYQKKTGELGTVGEAAPSHWQVDPTFNPFKTRSMAHVVAKSLDRQLREGSYEPRPAVVVKHDKPAGGTRQISISPVADAGLAALCFRRIQRRNQHRLSPYSFAYRFDVGVHEAIDCGWNAPWLSNK